jgi:bifunctional enzyme CysN/CysC
VDRSPDDAAEEILDYLRENGFLGA